MENKKANHLKLYFIISFLFIFFFSFLVFYVFEVQINNVKYAELRENEESLIDFQNQLLGQNFTMVLGDLHYLHHVYQKQLYDPRNKDQVAKDWIEFSNQRRIYDQIRFIDKNGNEIIRINHDHKQAILVEESDLQNKKDRYYFYETAALEDENVLVSPLDLNIENGEIEDPFKPMIRFSTPLYDQDGQFQGIIVLNYLADTVLKNFKELSKNSDGQIVLLNSDGYWLACDDESNEWNFMFEDKKEATFSNDYPNEWERLKEEKGQFITENGLFTFTTVHLTHQYQQGDQYQIDEQIIYSDKNWHIVSLITNENPLAPYFLKDSLLIIKDVFKQNSYQLIVIAVISGLVSLLVYLNRKKYYEIKYYSEYDPLTKALNRRAGYEKLKQLLYKDERRKVLFSLCFIDVNGLKQVNDHLGHEFGDELLMSVSDTIKTTIRASDFIIRQGGDEFLIILDDMDIKQAEALWQRIVDKFETINDNKKRPYIISVSHGIVEYSKKTDIDELIQEADEKMYMEKKRIKKNLNVLR